MDGHPHGADHDQLKRYWTVGKGRSRWSTWRELRDQLVSVGIPLEKSKRFAAQWFYETHGYWPGADLNRVANGKPPRGKRVGPG